MQIYAYMGYTNPTIYSNFFFEFFFCFVTAMSCCAKPNITMSNIEELLRAGQGNKCGKHSPSMMGTCRDSKCASEEGKFYRLDKVKTLDFSFKLELIYVESSNFSEM